MADNDFHPIGADDAVSGTDAGKTGLSSAETRLRISKYGYNEITAKKPNYYYRFARKFYGPVQALLWLVIILSYALGHMQDFYIVVALLVFNAVVGFAEEYKADVSVQALMGQLASKTRVLRDGIWTTLPARELVPGDVIRIKIGDIIPADSRIIESEIFESDESVISGESLPVEKSIGDTVYQGAIVRRGDATCIVTGTGYGTVYGKTARLVQKASPKSHLEIAIMHIVKYLVAADLAVIAVMFLYGFFLLHMGLAIMVPFLLVVFIASVPVALEAAFTVAMALGTERLARKSILVTRLEAIESTATMSILCADKTGTLTENRITVGEVVPVLADSASVLKHAAEASRREDNDPMDNAILDYAASLGVHPGIQSSFTPFSPETKCTSAVMGGESKYEVMKGAVVAVLKAAGLNGSSLVEISSEADALASRGMRPIMVAVKKPGGSWVIDGLVALYDKPRHDAKDLISELSKLGISVKMLTGDNNAVARHIAEEVGLPGVIVDMSSGVGRDQSLLELNAVSAGGFANVYPQDKYSLVRALQSKGYIVGMTGDGVNDAPALKQAEVGIAVSNATDVAKSAAALVLTKDGLGVIVDAVKESRRIFERMSTYAMAKVSKVFQIVGFIAITFMSLHFIPITAFLLILLIFTNDMVNISISTDNAGYSIKPDVWNVRNLLILSGSVGALLLVEALALIPVGFGLLGLSRIQFPTMVFLLLNVTDKFTVINLREKRAFWKSKPSAFLIIASSAGIIVGTAMAYFGILMPDIGIAPIAAVFLISLISVFVNDAVKLAVLKRI